MQPVYLSFVQKLLSMFSFSQVSQYCPKHTVLWTYESIFHWPAHTQQGQSGECTDAALLFRSHAYDCPDSWTSQVFSAHNVVRRFTTHLIHHLRCLLSSKESPPPPRSLPSLEFRCFSLAFNRSCIRCILANALLRYLSCCEPSLACPIDSLGAYAAPGCSPEYPMKGAPCPCREQDCGTCARCIGAEGSGCEPGHVLVASLNGALGHSEQRR